MNVCIWARARVSVVYSFITFKCFYSYQSFYMNVAWDPKLARLMSSLSFISPQDSI